MTMLAGSPIILAMRAFNQSSKRRRESASGFPAFSGPVFTHRPLTLPPLILDS
jgi:hypothetical protein